MPDRELRHMSRTELVEIIFALKQSEDQLKAENAALTAQLEDRQLHIQNAGSIAAMVLTTEAIVADKPEKKEPSMPKGGMGGMEDMY